MQLRHLALLMVFPSAGSFLVAQTVGVPLTLQQAIALARAQNPTLLSGQQHVTATKASEITAGLRQNPTFTFSGENVTLPANNPGNPYYYSANLSRLFERGQKRRWRLDSARGVRLPQEQPNRKAASRRGQTGDHPQASLDGRLPVMATCFISCLL